MHINWRHIATIAAFAGALGAPAAAAPPDMDEVPLTISGCVKAGEERDSFLLTNVVIDGTTLAPTNAFYRFNTTDGLEHYVGRRVDEVRPLQGNCASAVVVP